MIPYDCMIYFSKKQYDKCLEILEKEKNKDNINEILYKKSEIYYELAKIESDTKRLNKAIGLLKTLIKKDNNKTYNEYAFLASIYNDMAELYTENNNKIGKQKIYIEKIIKELKNDIKDIVPEVEKEVYIKKLIEELKELPKKSNYVEYYKIIEYIKAIAFYMKAESIANNNERRFTYIISKANALHNIREIEEKIVINDGKIANYYKDIIENSNDTNIYESAIIGYYNIKILEFEKSNIDEFLKIFEYDNLINKDKCKNIIDIHFIIHRVIIYFDKKGANITKKQFDNILEIIAGFDYIWEKEKEEYFNSIVSNENEDKYKKELKKLWILQYMLLDLLSIKKKWNIKDISTYMSIGVLKALTKDPKSKLKMFSISKVNDPKEGKILHDILNKNLIYIDSNDIENNFAVKKKNISFTILQESFTRLRDSLTMFRLYGKNTKYSIDGKDEGTGVCLVFNKNLFDTFFYHPSTPIADEQNKLLPIYFVLYYNREQNKLIFNPTASDYKNIEVDLNEENNYEWNNKEDDNLKLGDRIGYIFNRIFEKLKGLKNDKEALNKAYRLLINIRYLIKDSAFVEEQEMRILKIAKLSDSDIYYDNGKDSLCKEYVNIFENDALREIIIGPKVKEPVSLIEELQNAFENDMKAPYGLKFTISKSPLA